MRNTAMKKTSLLFITIGILVAALAFFIYQGTQDGTETYEETLVAYLEAMKEGTDKAIQYTAFPNETIEYDYLESPMRIADYEVVSSTQINRNLYVFTLNIAVTDQPGVYTPLYYFVGCQDGEYTVYINAAYVPEALHENFNADDYSYSNPNYLASVPQFEE